MYLREETVHGRCVLMLDLKFPSVKVTITVMISGMVLLLLCSANTVISVSGTGDE